MILEEIIGFLQDIPPFQFLEKADLRDLARHLSLEFYPKDRLILRQDGIPSEFLQIIKKGGVKVSMISEDGSEMVIDYRGEGDTFGFLSMIGKDRVRSNVIALEDTICLLLPKEHFLRYLDSNLVFTEFFLKTHITRYIDRTFREMQNKSLFYSGSDRLLFTTRAGDVQGSQHPVRVAGNATIREAAELMTAQRVTFLIIDGPDNRPGGIITDTDLRSKVVAKGFDVDRPAAEIMTRTIISVDAGDSCFEAVLTMLRHNIHHVMVMKDEQFVGVITNHDLMTLQGTSPLSLTKDIESQDTVDGLVPVTGKINRVVGLLLKEGAKAGNITKIIPELNDRMVRKILAIAEAGFGSPPLPYCWIVYGSEGRREQTFKTDQDNALIWADPADDAEQRAAEAYFSRFAVFVRESLVKTGFPLCPAGYMAANPLWRQPLRTWKRYFSDWVATPTPEALLHCLALLDFRPLHGDAGLGQTLRSHVLGIIRDNKVFLGHLANMAVKNSPPMGFFKSLVVEKSGEHKNELNIKIKGLAPLVDIVRLFALEKGIRETSTLERIDLLRERHTTVAEFGDEMEYAFELFMLLRIHHQYEAIQAGRLPDNFINPDGLSSLEKNAVKDSFGLVTRLQDAIIERYKTMIW